MRWYRINIDYLYYETDKNALNISMAAGKNLSDAINKYAEEIAKGEKCADDKSKNAKIDLTEYIYNRKTGTTRTVILAKNY